MSEELKTKIIRDLNEKIDEHLREIRRLNKL